MPRVFDGTQFLDLWWGADVRGQHGAKCLSPLFVADQGPALHVVDIRPAAEATGVMGAIPGSFFFSPERLLEVVRGTPRDLHIAIVSRDGEEAAQLALRLEALGQSHVAAIAGGLAAWRESGLGTSRLPMTPATAFPDEPAVAPHHTTLTLEQVRDSVGEPSAIRWIKFASLIMHQSYSCVDGRDHRSVIGTPGGDAGEFLLMLAAFEQATGHKLDERAIHAALRDHLDSFGAFYMHTDRDAFDALIGAVGEDPRLDRAVHTYDEPEQWAALLRTPDEGVRSLLLEQLVNPPHVGCGHLRLMLEHGDDYGVRRDVVLGFMRSFYQLMWAGAPELKLALLPGGHREGAVVNVRLGEPIWDLSSIPLVSPACAGMQMFLNHPDVSSRLRQSVIECRVRGLGGLSVDGSKVASLRAAFDELATGHLTRTLGALAKGLPVYDLEFERDSSFSVRHAGAIA